MDRPPGNRTLLFLAVLVALSGPLAAAGAAAPGSLFGVQSVDPDQVLLRVDLEENGDAQWRVEYRVRLDTQNETEAFNDLKRDVENNESAYLATFRDRINGTVGTAENATGRDMATTDFGVSARITQLPQEYGVLTYTFTWRNFAAVNGDRIVAGDALAGFFLDAETTLAIGWPAEYATASVSPEPTERQDRAVVWRGPLDFADGDPRVVVEPGAGGNGGPTGPGDGGTGVGPGTIAGVLLVVVLLGAAGVVYYRRSGVPGGGTGGTSPTGAGSAGPSGGGSGSSAGSGTAAAGDGSSAAAGAAAAGGGAGGGPTPDELLSNEERVVHFLEERGGRAKQQEIVDGLEWTDAKTSQVLSGMESDDQIEKFRIGRENVVKLPDEGDDETLEI